MTILILAAGIANRFGGKTKHLLSIAGEPLLARTVRQLRAMGHEPVVVTHRPELKAVSKHHEPIGRRWLCETILSTRELWGDKIAVLLGDVVWPDEVLRDVLAHDGSPCFFGNYCEIYAASWRNDENGRIMAAIARVLNGAKQWLNPGKMWQLYHAVIGATALNGRTWDYDVFRVIPSVGTPARAYTQDFDTVRMYQKFLSREGWARDAENWPQYEEGLQIVVTGTGRCGTGFMSRLLNSVGLPCGHEAIFTPRGLDAVEGKYGARADLAADSSWLAAPFLDCELARNAFIVHLVRHPRHVIDSQLRIGTMRADTPWTDFHWKHLPKACDMDLRDRLAYKYVAWNELIERQTEGRDYGRFCVEREPMELLKTLESKGIIDLSDADETVIFNDRRYNTRGQRGSQNVRLEDFNPTIRKKMLETAERYGYSW